MSAATPRQARIAAFDLHRAALAAAFRAQTLARNIREGLREIDAADAALVARALEGYAAAVQRCEAERMNAPVIPFGKHKGRTVDELRDLEWASAQPWFREKFESLYLSIVNVNTGEPAETPEHNAMQVRFLEPEYVDAFLRVAAAEKVAKEESELRSVARIRKLIDGVRVRLDRYNACSASHDGYVFLRSAIGHALCELRDLAIDDKDTRTPSEVRFEENGVDVLIYPGASIASVDPLGDDFPAAIRQVKKYGDVLARAEGGGFSLTILVGAYTGVGATREQFVRMAKASGITDVEAAL
jgi:hypothetical protein